MYRFVPMGGQPEHTIELADGTIAVVGDRRSVVRSDGSMAQASALGMGGIQVPARLGAGFLFWQNDLEYTSTFLGDPVRVAPLRTNVIHVHYGHDFVFLFGPGQERRAFALDPPRRVPLSPHGVVATGGADDDRVLAVDAAGRSRASIDGGRTWRDVTGEVGSPPQGILGMPNDVAFVLGQQGAWLRTDGTFERRALPSSALPPWAHPPAGRAAPAEPSPESRLYRAVLVGQRGPTGRVLLAEGADLLEVDISTGAGSGRRRIGPAGSSCGLATTEGDGLATCDTYSVRGPDMLDIVAHVLGSAPGVEKTFPHHPQRFAVGASLVVVAPCPEGDAGGAAQPTGQVVCVRGPAGSWTQFDAGPALGTKWKVLGWVGREGGAPVAVVWEQGVRGRTPDHGLLDPVRGTVVTLDAEVGGLGNVNGRWTVRADGTLHGFGPSAPVTIDAKGHVTAGGRSFGALASADDHALARDPEGRLWQTADAGATWIEVARPPYDRGAQMSFGQMAFPSMTCGRLGCAIGHPSGLGNWIRFGWPNDPPHATSDGGPSDVAAPPAGGAGTVQGRRADAGTPAAVRPDVVLPRLVCTMKGPLEASTDAPPPAVVRATAAKSVEVLGGLRLPHGGAASALVTPYRDEFRAPDDLESRAALHALRAVLRSDEAPGVPSAPGLSSLPDLDDHAKRSVEALYVEVFDPSGRIRRASGSLGAAPSVPAPSGNGPPATPAKPPPAPSRGTGPRPPPEPTPSWDETFNPARPVLASDKPGEAAGVLVETSGPALWISPSGTVRRVAACGGDFHVYGGVADAAGKLWIACGVYSRAFRVIDASTGQTRMTLPAVLPWVWQPAASFPLYGGGSATELPNPDAIAVGAAGKLAVLRLPSEEPATVDDPAWLLSPDAGPVELAPWSTLETADSAACMARSEQDDAVRALVQTAVAWVTLEASAGFRRPPGMTALVRWSRSRVCLEAIEVGYREIEQDDAPRYGVQVMAVARFAGAHPGAGLVGVTRSETYRVPAVCRLDATQTSAPSRR